MKIPLKFWRCRFSQDTPFGNHASFAPGNNGIESVEYDSETGIVTLLRKTDGVILGVDGFGYFEREEPKGKAANPSKAQTAAKVS